MAQDTKIPFSQGIKIVNKRPEEARRDNNHMAQIDEAYQLVFNLLNSFYGIIQFDFIIQKIREVMVFKGKMYILTGVSNGYRSIPLNNIQTLSMHLSLPLFALPTEDQKRLYNALFIIGKFNTDYAFSCDSDTEYFKAIQEICFHYGLPNHLDSLDNFTYKNGVLFYKTKRAVQPLTPETIRQFYIDIFPKPLPNSVVYKIQQILIKYAKKETITLVPGIQCYKENKRYSITYKSGQFFAELVPDLYPIKQEWQVHNLRFEIEDSNIILNNIKDALFTISLADINGVQFWSKLIANTYTYNLNKGIFIVYLSKPLETTASNFLNWLESFFGNLYFFLQSQRKDLSFYSLAHTVPIIFNLDERYPNKFDILTKLVRGNPICMSESSSDWTYIYKNIAPIIAITTDRQMYQQSKQYFTANKIKCFDLSLEVSTPLPKLSQNDIAYLKWCLLSSLFHPFKNKKPVSKSLNDVLAEFIKTFCEITGNKNDTYRSRDFYSQYVVPFYESNHLKAIGYKSFNRALKTYQEGLMGVSAIHKTSGDNVQHIWGIKFDAEKYEKYINNSKDLSVKNKEIYTQYIDDLFGYVEEDYKKINAAIEKCPL